MLLVFLSLMFKLTLSAQTDVSPDGLSGLDHKLSEYTGITAPQKLFLHTDKTNYMAGETIWFKAYLVNGVTHQPDLSEANVYVEIRDTEGNMVHHMVLKPRGGSAAGDIELDASFADGNYQIRAYTDWMLNSGEDFLFHKSFYLENPGHANRIDNSARRFNRNFNRDLERKKQEHFVHFFPEGGRLVHNVLSRVAVKVTDATGKGIEASGRILDSGGSEAGGFSTNAVGLGVFSLTPSATTGYRAEVQIPGNRPFIAELPDVASQGFVLRVDMPDQETLELTVHHSSASAEPGRCAILAHTRGQANFFLPELGVQESETIRIPLSDFPTGITHITLFSDGGQPLAERLVFVNHDDQAYFDIRALSLRSGEANALHIDVLASDRQGIPMEGDFSASVQFGNIGERSHRENIFSYLFMSSDLVGLVQDPALYFDYEQESVEEAVDMLMLTHGWRRFRWTNVLSSTSPVLAHAPSFGTTVSGMLTGPDNEVRNAEVSLRKADDKSQVFTTQTNERGFFSFENLPFTDSVLVEILAPISAQGVEPGVEILSFGERGGPESDWSYEMNPLTKPQQITARGRDWSRVRTPRDPEAVSGSNSPYGRPDQTIYVDQNQPYASVLDILRDKAIGLIISPAGNITVRGPTSIQNQQPPIFIIDGVESQGAFMGAHVRDIERIEVFRGASTAAFGSRGASGALVAYTKRRDFDEETSPQHMFLIAGLHAPREFYTGFEMPLTRLEDNQVKTIMWEPGLVTGVDGLASFQFLPPSGVGRYRIVIQGIGKDGKVGFGEFLIGN